MATSKLALFCRVILHGRVITLRVFLQTSPQSPPRWSGLRIASCSALAQPALLCCPHLLCYTPDGAPVAQLDRAQSSQLCGRQFESGRGHLTHGE